MSNNIFGQIVTPKQVRVAVTDTIKLWINDYLAEIGERDGRERSALPPFRSYVPMINVSRFNEDQTPTCVIVAPGTISVRRRAGKQDARWAVGIGAVVSGQSPENTYELCELYGAAIVTLLLQHASLGGFAEGISLISVRSDELRTEDARTLGAAIVQIGVDVNGIVDISAGPITPSADAMLEPGDWPLVESIHQSFTQQGVESGQG